MAASVIVVYLVSQKPEWLENVKDWICERWDKSTAMVKTLFDAAKLYVVDKLSIDLDNDEEVKKAKKFALLAVVVVIGVFLYGKKALGKYAVQDDGETVRKKDEKRAAFFGTLVSALKKISPTVFSAIASFLATKGMLKLTEEGETVLEESEQTASETPKPAASETHKSAPKKPRASGSKPASTGKKPTGEPPVAAEGTVE